MSLGPLFWILLILTGVCFGLVIGYALGYYLGHVRSTERWAYTACHYCGRFPRLFP